MYPSEAVLSPEDLSIIFTVRQLISDSIEVYVDDYIDVSQCAKIKVSGSMYELDYPKGYPIEVYVNGVEYTSTSGALGVEVLSYKYLRFTNPSGVLSTGSNLTVIYNSFRHSDLEIINTYDIGATIYLTDQCGLTHEDLTVDLLVLATSFILLSKDLNTYIKEGLNIEDGTSRIDATFRARDLNNHLNMIKKQLQTSLEAKMKCKMLNLPIYRVE